MDSACYIRKEALGKVPTDANPADLFTKPVTREVIDMHLETFGVQLYRGRSGGVLNNLVWM